MHFSGSLWTSVDGRRGQGKGTTAGSGWVLPPGPAWKAEGEGFEPSIRLTTDNGFRDRRIRPLCHPSVELVRALCGAEKEGFEPSREEFTPLTP